MSRDIISNSLNERRLHQSSLERSVSEYLPLRLQIETAGSSRLPLTTLYRDLRVADFPVRDIHLLVGQIRNAANRAVLLPPKPRRSLDLQERKDLRLSTPMSSRRTERPGTEDVEMKAVEDVSVCNMDSRYSKPFARFGERFNNGNVRSDINALKRQTLNSTSSTGTCIESTINPDLLRRFPGEEGTLFTEEVLAGKKRSSEAEGLMKMKGGVVYTHREFLSLR